MSNNKTQSEPDVRKTMQKLEPLDLRRCHTVGDLVAAMVRCSFGARMLGEAALTLHAWCEEKEKPSLVYDGGWDAPLVALLKSMLENGWFRNIMRSEALVQSSWGAHDLDRVLVVGNYSEERADALYKKVGEAIFINKYGRARPGQVKDGYFPNAVFADPDFIIAILYRFLLEKNKGVSMTVDDFVSSAEGLGGLTAQVLKGADVLLKMVEDDDCTVFMTASGAMTIAKMGLLFCEMIEGGMINCLATTGALMAHGLIEGVGLSHYKYDPSFGDTLLAKQSLNRVTDTLEPEENFDHIDEVMDAVLSKFDGKKALSPSRLHKHIGHYLGRQYPENRGILRSAYEHDVAVMVPAFHDSELGNDFYTHNLLRMKRGLPALVMDQEQDTEKLLKLFVGAKRLGIFSIGGGVPRNHIQNLAPLTEIINARKAAKLPVKKFSYGLRIDPAEPWFGNLGGCTYEENMSWRKFHPNARYAQLQTDATIVWPFILKYVMERRDR